jgi:putative nucleotidyltransferase with HDIG domain
MGILAEIGDDPKPKRPWALQDLPPFHPVARKLMLLAARDDVPLTRVEQVLRTDAAFASEVLRLANSPLIATRGGITSILQAVALLGVDHIKKLATTLVLRTFLTTGTVRDSLRGCWHHNLATALICERLGHSVHLDSETCYTAGLLHDIGRLALLRKYPGKYERILAVKGVNDLDLLQLEKAEFDIDHCQAGAWILEQWEFPKELSQVASLHHRRPENGELGLLPVVYAGCRIADLSGFSVGNQRVSGDIAEIADVLPDKARQQVIGEFDGLAEEVAFKINAIECALV